MKILGALGLAVATALLIPQPAQAHSRRPVYVVGDSISIGGGTSVPSRRSFPVDAARILDRRIRIIGHGGRCLTATFCPDMNHLPVVQTFRQEVLAAKPRPTTVIVELGVNDMNHVTDEQLEDAYRTVIREGRQAGVRVVLCTITPQGDGLPWPVEWTAAQRIRINRWIRHQKTPYLEFAWALGGRTMDPKYNSGDGLHPNDAGARVLGKVLARYLERHP